MRRQPNAGSVTGATDAPAVGSEDAGPTSCEFPEEEEMNRITRMIGLFSVMAALVALPAVANAQPVNPTGGSGGCHHTDKDGYDIPIDEGQSVIVDGKVVTCTGGTVVITNAPLSTQGGTKKPPKRVVVVKKAKTVSASAKR
jgi:hypothetical protein